MGVLIFVVGFALGVIVTIVVLAIIADKTGNETQDNKKDGW